MAVNVLARPNASRERLLSGNPSNLGESIARVDYGAGEIFFSKSIRNRQKSNF
jgi:hypothetical protein